MQYSCIQCVTPVTIFMYDSCCSQPSCCSLHIKRKHARPKDCRAAVHILKQALNLLKHTVFMTYDIYSSTLEKKAQRRNRPKMRWKERRGKCCITRLGHKAITLPSQIKSNLANPATGNHTLLSWHLFRDPSPSQHPGTRHCCWGLDQRMKINTVNVYSWPMGVELDFKTKQLFMYI